MRGYLSVGSGPSHTDNMSRLSIGLVLILLVLGSAFAYRTYVSQEELPTTGYFGGVSLRIDYATSTAARELGLGDRTSIPADYGMLFVFPKDDRYGFWMKDTLVPLDMFWLDDKGHVVSLATSVSPSSYPSVFYPSVPARYVLETAAGFALAHSIATGTPLTLKKFPTVTE